jgi:hypothetical protein
MAYSDKFELVHSYYQRKLWDEDRVQAAVGRWITADEAHEILSCASCASCE